MKIPGTPSDKTSEIVERICSEALTKLMGHCDSAIIFITTRNDAREETGAYSDDRGNIYASIGAVSLWLKYKTEKMSKIDPGQGGTHEA